MEVLFFIGTSSFALSGYLIGVKKNFDLLGIIIIALLTAIGGGIIRDALVNRLPLVFSNAHSLFIIFGTLAIAWMLRLHRRDGIMRNKIFIVSDSIGLVAFSIGGAQVGIDFHLNFFGVMLLAFVTAIGGGIVRDMMVNDVPFILNRDFYGTVSILTGGGLYLLNRFGYTGLPFIYALFAIGLAIRLYAHARDFRLPVVRE